MISTTHEGHEVQEGSDDVWAYISPARLNTWLRCPLAFKLRYIDGIRSPPSQGMFVGKMVHAGLECYYRHKQLRVQLPVGEVVERMNGWWEPLAAEESIEFKDSLEEANLRQQTSRLVTAYLRQLPANEATPTIVETRLEVPLVDPFSGQDLGIGLLGVVDLVVNGEDGPLVCDFKTSSRSCSPVETMHEVQLTAYAYLFRQLSHEMEAGLEIRRLIKTKDPKIEYHRYAPRTNAHLRRFFEVVRQYLDDLERSSFVYRPGFGCTLCDFRDGPCTEALG